MILILNIGLKNARCIIYNIAGELMADFSQSVKTFINNEKVEQSPHEWRELAVVFHLCASYLTVRKVRSLQRLRFFHNQSLSCTY